MSKRIVVFGATGGTGSHVVRLALEAGLLVRAFVRTPSKVSEDVAAHPNLEIFEGDFTDFDAVDRAIEGADIVVSHAGNAPESKRGYVMLPFIKQVVASMREHGVKRLLYQAGAFSPCPGSPSPFFIKAVMRPILGGITGISGMLKDNDAVIEYLSSEAADLEWTITRPGMLKQGQSQGTVRATDKLSTPVSFVDLASFSLDTARADDHLRECPYLSY